MKLSKLQYIRHPYLLTRWLLRSREYQDEQKHMKRLEEYKKYEMSLESALKYLIGTTKHYKQIEHNDFLKYIEDCARQNDLLGDICYEYLFLLYSLVKFLKPLTIVETGVANGFSSAFILRALMENKKGTLQSVDLHYRDGVTFPAGKSLGWVIPEEYKNRWKLHLGESRKVLPKLMRELQMLDIFLHDSRHTYRTMMGEFQTVWPYISKGGFLVADDIRLNDAFLDFATSFNVKPFITKRVGVMQKP